MKGLVWVPATSSNPPLLMSSHYNLRSSLGTPQRIKHQKLTTSSSSLVDSAVAQLNDDDKPNNELPFSGCKGCGKEEIETGCNGEGRIQGGIATIPGFGWWPIKAYRPCPGFLASGGNYRRRGQSMDEVAFGGGGGRNKKEKEV